jgi:transposase-like protein
MDVASVAKAIERGGGVFAKALIVGPRQERWLQVLEHVDRGEVERAVASVVRRAVTITDAANYLNVEPDFLFRYKLPASAGKKPLGRWRRPTTAEQALPIVAARVEATGKGGAGTGAWRVEDLLDDPVSKRAALAALATVLSACSSIDDVARSLGVSRALVWQWRKRWPELDAIVAPKRAVRSSVALKSGGRRRLTLDEGIALMRGHLPGTATEVAEKIAAANASAVEFRPRQLSFYVGKPGAGGLMVARSHERRGRNVVKIWILVDTKTGERVDGGERKKGTNGTKERPKRRRR